ncbi:DNA oxidative demethylase AlkB [Enterobacter mori]
MLDLFADAEPGRSRSRRGGYPAPLCPFRAAALLTGIDEVAAVSPFRHMVTPGGYTMSVAMTNCGQLGWATNERGYLYAPNDPTIGKPWPPMPDAFQRLCHEAAVAAGYADFQPDACLINRYAVGAKLSLHQDKDEPDLRAPIVSVSLGLPAVFQFGGLRRNDPLKRLMLEHGDVVVWGGESRLFITAFNRLNLVFIRKRGRFALT